MNRTAKATIAALALTATVFLTGCSINGGYTGTGTLVEHHQNGKNCHVEVAVPNKGQMEMSAGSWSRCDVLTDGQTVNIKDGFFQNN